MMESCSAVRSAMLISIAVRTSAVRFERVVDYRADLKTRNLIVQCVSKRRLAFAAGFASLFKVKRG